MLSNDFEAAFMGSYKKTKEFFSSFIVSTFLDIGQ